MGFVTTWNPKMISFVYSFQWVHTDEGSVKSDEKMFQIPCQSSYFIMGEKSTFIAKFNFTEREISTFRPSSNSL